MANPLASVLSAALLLENAFGYKEAAESVIQAVEETLNQGYRTADIAHGDTAENMILTTDAMGEKVLGNLKSK